MSGRKGLTLIEVLVVVFIISVLLSVSIPYMFSYIRDLRAFKEAVKVYEDLIAAQAYAIKYGGASLSTSSFLVERRIFVVFDGASSYKVYLWTDSDNDGSPRTEELELLLENNLNFATFSVAQDIDKSACTNSGSAPSSGVTFQVRSYPPCNGKPCVRFHPYGFVEGLNGAIYMSYNDKAYAISINKAGYIRFCKWVGNRWVLK